MQLTRRRHLPAQTDRFLPRTPRAGAIAVLAVTMAMVFALDRLTGFPHVQHLYYFPIILAGVVMGTPGGIGAAATAIVLYHLANPHAMTLR